MTIHDNFIRKLSEFKDTIVIIEQDRKFIDIMRRLDSVCLKINDM
jgi:hypothetical protein